MPRRKNRRRKNRGNSLQPKQVNPNPVEPDNHPDNPNDNDSEIAEATIYTESFEGPLPHPKILAQYEQAHPGAAKVILDSFQSEQRHRHEIVSRVQAGEHEYRMLGLTFAFFIVLGILAGSVYLIVHGEYLAGGSLLTIVISLLIKALLKKDKPE